MYVADPIFYITPSSSALQSVILFIKSNYVVLYICLFFNW
jgi:hypothetical protein